MKLSYITALAILLLQAFLPAAVNAQAKRPNIILFWPTTMLTRPQVPMVTSSYKRRISIALRGKVVYSIIIL